MYKCTICSKEYEIKPDYCDCGNDTFDEIVEAKSLEEDFEVEKRKFPTKKSSLDFDFYFVHNFINPCLGNKSTFPKHR